ncbi:MAG: 23S rRNA (guanosine(2251)-2'-O)-methyltransferase RlmB [Deltaproteobacteria bacterium]|nr:23S rRNA (guanosine(2251)-2'-O)-methyltransferase RlmB [Deltaproteobacteria bacterium]
MQVIYGIHPSIEALRSGRDEIERIFLARGRRGPDVKKILDLATEKKIPVELGEREYLDRLADGSAHQGVVCQCRPYTYYGLNEMIEGKDSLNDCLILILDCIVDPQNLGSLIRTGHCFGVAGIIIPEKRSASVTPSVIKTSAGAAHHVPIARVVNIARTVDYLKERGFWIYGADASCEEDLRSFDYEGPVCLIMGSENKGIRPLVKKKCDFMISIPMRGHFDSLNVSVAGGIILHEINRRKFEML